MEYKINEQEIIQWAINKLPNINSFNKKIAVVFVNDFIGETEIISQNRYSEIILPNEKTIILDKKNKSYYYYAIFQKIEINNKLEWDFIGYDKQEIYSQ